MLKAHQVLLWTDTGSPAGLNLKNIYVGPDPIGIGAFQVAVVEASGAPSREALKKLFKNRKLKTNIQLVVMATVGDQAWLFGPDADTATIEAMQLSQAERLLQSALDEPDALAAYARIGQLRRSIDTSEEQRDLIQRLNGVPSVKVERSIRRVLNGEGTERQIIELLRDTVSDAGLQPSAPVKPLPPVTDAQVRLVAWMAVEGTADQSVMDSYS